MKLSDLYKKIVRNTEVKIFYDVTEISYEDAKNMKVCLIIPDGELKMNIFVTE